MNDKPTVSFDDYHALKKDYDIIKENYEQIKQQLDWFKRQLFGRKSEKRIIDEDPTQTLLFSASDSPKSAPPEMETVPGYQRCKKQRDACVTENGLRFTADVPVKTITLSCPELEGDEADQYLVVSEKITHRLAQQPGSYVILKYVRQVVKHKVQGKLVTTPAPPAVFDRSIADVSFLAGMLVDKFTYHLPLYRQYQRLSQSGITLSRKTLTQLTHRSIALLEPIVEAQFKHCLNSKVLAMDETPIKAGRAQKGKLHQGYFWPVYGESDEVVFIYASGRSEAVLHEHLKDFTGTLLTDGYEAYARYCQKTSNIAANCWAHTRRQFEKALVVDKIAADEALSLIGELYEEEKNIREKQLTGKKKLQHRQTISKPIVDRFWKWCNTQCQRLELTPNHLLSKALKYAMKRRAALEVFLGDPKVSIDTNHLERTLRVIPMGRKAWLFCWTEVGAKLVGIIQSLLMTCRLQGVDPYTYLVDVLQRVSDHPANLVHELTPRLWKEKFADNPKRSDLYNTT